MVGEETVAIILVAVIYIMFDKELARRLFFITAASLGVNSIVKNFVKRPRPFSVGAVTCVRSNTATGYSFPSGHTQNVATWSTALAIRFKKFRLMLFAVLVTALVAFSRMFLGAHYPSDVIAGAIFGIAFAFICSGAYDRVSNKNILYGAVILILAPFAILFLFHADPLYADFYKLYGMFLGAFCSVLFEEKYVAFDYDTAVWKKILRVVIAVILAFVIKEGIKKLFVFESVQLLLIGGMIRYFILVFTVFGLYPLLFKKFDF